MPVTITTRRDLEAHRQQQEADDEARAARGLMGLLGFRSEEEWDAYVPQPPSAETLEHERKRREWQEQWDRERGIYTGTRKRRTRKKA